MNPVVRSCISLAIPFLLLLIMAATQLTLQLQQECIQVVCSNEVVLKILGAIADGLPAVQNVVSLLAPEHTPHWTISRWIESTASA